ncbi:SLC13 family permease [Streptomyces anthocyanicus]|uniref:SLC13 family permease n=1 Tax=Streptomyces anthocyanicus TaxID=68174 RepID=UPI00365BE7DA
MGVLRDPHGAPTYSPQVRDPAFHNRAVAETGPCGFRTSFVHDEQRAVEIMALEEREAIKDPRLLALVVAGFVLHPVLRYEPSIVALLGAGLLIAVSSAETGEVLSEVEWPTLAFFAGLFIMIGGLIDTAHHPLAVHQIGLVVTAATVTISLIYVWLRYFALAA